MAHDCILRYQSAEPFTNCTSIAPQIAIHLSAYEPNEPQLNASRRERSSPQAFYSTGLGQKPSSGFVVQVPEYLSPGAISETRLSRNNSTVGVTPLVRITGRERRRLSVLAVGRNGLRRLESLEYRGFQRQGSVRPSATAGRAAPLSTVKHARHAFCVTRKTPNFPVQARISIIFLDGDMAVNVLDTFGTFGQRNS